MTESIVRFHCELIIDRIKLTPAAAKYVGEKTTQLLYVRTFSTTERLIPRVRDQFHTGAMWTNLAVVAVTSVIPVQPTPQAPWSYRILLHHHNRHAVGVKTLQALKKANWQRKA